MIQLAFQDYSWSSPHNLLCSPSGNCLPHSHRRTSVQKLDLSSLASEGCEEDDMGRVSLAALSSPRHTVKYLCRFSYLFWIQICDILLLCMSVQHLCLVSPGVRECQKPSNCVSEGCRLPCRFWGLNSCLMTEQWVFLTTQPPLRTYYIFLKIMFLLVKVKHHQTSIIPEYPKPLYFLFYFQVGSGHTSTLSKIKHSDFTSTKVLIFLSYKQRYNYFSQKRNIIILCTI